jgi:hypothetical protein
MNAARLAAVAAAAATAAALAGVALAGTIKIERFAPTAADQRLASNVSLRRAELPSGWRFALSARPSAPDSANCAGYAPDFSKFTVTGHAESTFTAPAQAVVSQVEVFRTAAEARSDFKLGTTAGAWSCARSTVLDELRHGATGLTVTTTRWKVSRPTPTVYEATGVFTVQTPGGAAPILLDMVALQAGRGVVALMVITPAAKPIPQAAALARALGARSTQL